jgi:L-asparaginase II
MNSGEVLLEIVRNDLVESVHSGHILILDRDGREVLVLGDVDQLIYPRSAVKSLQTSAMLRAGLKLNEQQIALACASHAGSSEHLAVVRSTLARCHRLLLLIAAGNMQQWWQRARQIIGI